MNWSYFRPCGSALSWPLEDNLILMHAILLHDSLASFEVTTKLEIKVPFPLPQHSPLVKHENYAHHYGYCVEEK